MSSTSTDEGLMDTVIETSFANPSNTAHTGNTFWKLQEIVFSEKIFKDALTPCNENLSPVAEIEAVVNYVLQQQQQQQANRLHHQTGKPKITSPGKSPKHHRSSSKKHHSRG